jgi:hypothetical protein
MECEPQLIQLKLEHFITLASPPLDELEFANS